MTNRALTSLAIVLSLIGLVIVLVLDEIVTGSAAPDLLKGTAVLLVGMGAYAFVVQFLLSRRRAHAVRTDWPLIITLNWALLTVSLLSMLDPASRGNAARLLVVALFSLGCSFAGAFLAQRTAAHSSGSRSIPGML